MELNAAASDTSGRFIAAGRLGSNNSLYEINSTTGVATFLMTPINPPSSRSIRAVAINCEDGAYLVWSTSSVTTVDILTEIDLTTRELSGQVNLGSLTGVQGLAFGSSGNLFGANVFPNTFHSFNVNTGETVQIGSFGSNIIQTLEYDDSQRLMYAASQTTLFLVDTATGALTTVGPIGVSDIRGLAIVQV